MAEIIGEEHLDEAHRQRGEILLFMLGQLITTQSAAEQLAALSLETNNIELTWVTILDAARRSEDRHLNTLVNLLVDMVQLPPAMDSNGEQLMLYNMKIWEDLPTLGWEFNDEWNGLTIPQEQPKRQKAIDGFIRINKFAARLMKTGLAVFNYDLFALWSMRSALETPLDSLNPEMPDIPEVTIPAAAVWISILGVEMSLWHNEYPYGAREGDPGGGAPLWHGQHGFCRERWTLWRDRFGELSADERLIEEFRDICEKAKARMAEIEADQC